MTMQVGLVGTDGIVLASDTKWMLTGAVRQTTSRSKMLFNQDRSVVISCARCLEKSMRVAEDIIAELKEEEAWRYPIVAAERIAQAVMDVPDDPANPRNEAECLILSTRPYVQLHFLEIAVVNQVPRRAYCRTISDKVVAGDKWNSGIFWTERFYERCSIRELLPLAAQVIVSAANLNPVAIGGLEIGDGVRQISDIQIAELQERAKNTEWLSSSLLRKAALIT